jgi:Sigma-70, region 4
LDDERRLPEPFVIAVRARCAFTVLDFIRQRGNYQRRTEGECGEELTIGTAEEDPEIVKMEDDMAFEAMLAPLSKPDRDIVYRRLSGDESYDEIAKSLGKAPASVRQRYSRAITQLRVLASAEGGKQMARYSDPKRGWRIAARSGGHGLRRRPSRGAYRRASELIERVLGPR